MFPSRQAALRDARAFLESFCEGAGVARQALRLDKHVFLYSDNVSLEDEIALRQEAARKGLLVMGPDCGTAMTLGGGAAVE